MKFLLLISILMLAGCSEEEPASTEKAFETITLSVSGPKQFGPHNMHHRSAQQAMGFVYEPLYYEDIPVLAEKTEKSGKIADIYIKDHVLWHDGQYLKAEDVAYTINLVAEGRSVYSEPLIKKAEVISPLVVRVYFEIKVKEPEKYLTFPIIQNGAPLSPSSPVGTGPLCYSERVSYDTFSFAPYEKYHGQGYKSTRLLIIYPGKTEREYSLFRAGATDGVYIEHDQLASFVVPANTKIFKLPTKHILIVGMNCISLPEAVRRAIYYAFDSEAIAEQVLGDRARIFDRTDSPNLQMAHDEMRAGGFALKEGRYCRISIAVQKGEDYITLVEELTSQLEELGIQCTTSALENAKEDFKKGIYDMVITPWQSDGGIWELAGPGNILLYENSHLQNLISRGEDELEIKNIIHRQVPFIPLAALCDGVAVKKHLGERCTPVYSFAYLGMINGEI